MRLLFAEDEKYLNRILTRQLMDNGFSVDSCGNGREALECLDVAEYDAVILDIMMPELDGITVVRTMRARKISAPVLLLTARDAVEDRVKGLDAGADDYLTKPFAFEELMARLRALLRRGNMPRGSVLAVGDLTLDPATKAVVRGEKNISLSAREYSVLEYMMRNQGIVLSRAQIENHIFNFDYQGASNVVDVYIRYLRNKIDEGFDQKLIHTVRGMGYVLREQS